MADDEPILERLPQLQRQVQRKYSPTSPLAPYLSGFSPAVNNALQLLDQEAINRGSNPYTQTETLYGGKAAEQGRMITQEPDQPWYRDLVSDVGTLATSIPKLPVALANEITELPQVGVKGAEALAKSGGNPLEAVGNLAQVPGLRMIPGSFVASQFGTGGQGVGGLTEHPLFTALDVLPFAEKAASLTPAVRTATDVAAKNAELLGELPRPVPKITTALTKSSRVTEAPFLGLNPEDLTAAGTTRMGLVQEPNIVGRALERVTQPIAESRIGTGVKNVTGRNSQTLMRLTNRHTGEIHSWIADPARAPDEMTRAAAQVVSDNIAAEPTFSTIAPERRVELQRGLTLGKLPDNLNPAESQFITTYKSGLDTVTRAARDSGYISPTMFEHGEELLDTATAKRVESARRRAGVLETGDYVRQALRDPTAADPATLHYYLQHMVGDEHPALGLGMKRNLADGMLAALDAHGVDTTEARKLLVGSDTKAGGKIKGDWQQFADYVKDNNLKPPDTPVTPEPPTSQAERALSKLEQTNVTGSRSYRFDDRSLNVARRRVTQVEKSAVPARWDDLTRDVADTKIEADIRKEFANSPDLDKMLSSAASRTFQDLPESYLPRVRALQREARQSWQELAEAGHEPVYVHRAAPEVARRNLLYPRTFDYTPTPSSVKARTWDASPQQLDPMIALSHQAMEFLIRKGSQQAVDSYLIHLARPGAELMRELEPAAREAMARNPTADFSAHLRAQFAKKGWKPFDPDSFINGTVAKSDMALGEQLFMPSEVVDNLTRLKPKPDNLTKATLSAPMKIFRTSVLPLSPRWHVNNIIGGAIMLLAQSRNPLTIARYARDAWDMARHGGVGDLERLGVPQDLARLAPPGGEVAIEEKVLRKLDLQKNPDQLFHFAGGQTLRRILTESWQKTGGNVVEKSFKFNQLFDDFYRSMAYLEGKATKGLTEREGIKLGITRARDVLQKWDTLTPIERETVRLVFPFYSWAKTLVGYVTHFPATHPWRTNIMSNLARAEEADMQSGVPQRLRSLLFLGEPDENGNQRTINLQGANPFKDLANYASLAGFFLGGEGDMAAVTQSLNPLLSTTLEATGIDPTKGKADLFPDAYYDPVSGTMAVRSKQNLPLSLVNNLLPQSEIFTNLAGLNRDFADLSKRDPDAASRHLASSLGLPVATRELNIPRETIKAEVQRYRAQRTDRNEALRSGNLDLMAQWPGLRAFHSQMATLKANQSLGKYTPEPNAPGNKSPGVQELLYGTIAQS